MTELCTLVLMEMLFSFSRSSQDEDVNIKRVHLKKVCNYVFKFEQNLFK